MPHSMVFLIGSLIVFGPLKLIENDTIRRCGFVGVDMASLKKMILGAGFKVVHAREIPQCVSPLPVAAYQDIASTTPA